MPERTGVSACRGTLSLALLATDPRAVVELRGVAFGGKLTLDASAVAFLCGGGRSGRRFDSAHHGQLFRTDGQGSYRAICCRSHFYRCQTKETQRLKAGLKSGIQSAEGESP